MASAEMLNITLPDGAVRPVDYDQEPIGNLTETPMLALWNSAAMARRRRAALGRAPRGRGACGG